MLLIFFRLIWLLSPYLTRVFLFSRQMSDKLFYLITVKVKLERKLLYQDFHYKYFTNQDSATTYQDFNLNTASLKVLKLTKEELSRGKVFFLNIGLVYMYFQNILA